MSIHIWWGNHLMDCYWEVDRENQDFPPYLISHGQKIGSSRVLLAMRSEVDDCVCAALQIWSARCGGNISGLEVAQNYSVSLHALLGKDQTRPNFCSIADGAIIRGGISSPGSPYLVLWLLLRSGLLELSSIQLYIGLLHISLFWISPLYSCWQWRIEF